MNFIYNGLNLKYGMGRGELNFLTVEHPLEFDRIVCSIDEAINGVREEIWIEDNTESISLHKFASLISSPIEMDVTGTMFKKKLFETLAVDFQEEDVFKRYNEISSEIISLIDRIAMDLDFEVDFEPEIEQKDLFSAIAIRPKALSGHFAERLTDYIKITHRLIGHYIFFVANCSGFLDTEDYVHLKKVAEYEDIYIMLIDSHQIDLDFPRKEVIIDRDLCEI